MIDIIFAFKKIVEGKIGFILKSLDEWRTDRLGFSQALAGLVYTLIDFDIKLLRNKICFLKYAHFDVKLQEMGNVVITIVIS